MVFLRVSLIKIPYWLVSLILLYYCLSYKFSLNKLDIFIKRELKSKNKLILAVFLSTYIILVIILKLAFWVCYVMNSNTIFKNELFQQEFFGGIILQENDVIIKKEKMDTPPDIVIVTIETILECLILTLSIAVNIITEKNDHQENNKIRENFTKILNDDSNTEISNMNRFSILKELFIDHQNFKNEKYYFYVFQFFLISLTLVFNISIVNLFNLLFFCLMIIIPLFSKYNLTYNKYLDYMNKMYTCVAFILLNFHYIKNISQLKNQKNDNIWGITNFESNYSIIFFLYFYLAYSNSCILQKYEINNIKNDLKEVKKLFPVVEKKRIKSSINSQDHNSATSNFFSNLPKNLLNFFTNISQMSYRIVLLLWILFHVCVFMFINFLILFFGINKNKKIFKKFFLLPSLMVSLLFTIMQFIYNMNGVFIFENIRVYKLLEIVGVYKYYKSKVSDDYSNLKMLDESTEEKIKGMFTDMIVIIFLFICALAMVIENRKDAKRNLSLDNLNANAESPPNPQENQNQILSELDILINFISEKSFILCLLIIFMCSIIKFDLLHIIYFAFFIVLVCVSDSKFKSVWDCLLLINRFIIIIVLYFWNILAVNFLDLERETNPENENIFTYLGLKINKNSIFFVEYWEHIFLYLFGYIHHYFFVILYKKDYSNQMYEGISNAEEEKIQVKNIYKLPEWTRYYTILIVITFMVILALIKPLSFQGLFFLSLCLLLIIAHLFIVSKSKTNIIKTLIKVLIICSIASIILKYSINFSFLVNYLKDNFNLDDISKFRITEESLNTSENTVNSEKNISLNMNNNNNPNDIENPHMKSFSLQDFGLDNRNLNLKLFINALLIIGFKIMYYYSTEESTCSNNLISNNNQNQNTNNILHSKVESSEKGILSYLQIITFQIIYLHSCKIMFVVTVFICVCMESMIGVVLFGVVLISLFLELKSGWKYSFFPLIFISIMVMSFIYMCNLSAFKKWMTKDYEWFGLYNVKSGSVFYDLLPYIFIVFVAFLTRISSGFKLYYKDEDEIKQLEGFVKYEQGVIPIEEEKESENQSETRNFISYVASDENKNVVLNEEKVADQGTDQLLNNQENNQNKLLTNEISPLMENQKNKELLTSNLDISNQTIIKINLSELTAFTVNKSQDDIIVNLSKIWHKIDYFWYLYGYYIVLITIMLVAFIKVNVLSLIFMTFVGLQSFGVYHRTEFMPDKMEETKKNMQRIKRTWMLFATFLAIFTFLQYMNYMWFPPSWKISKPWEHLSFFCAKEGKAIYSEKLHYANTSDYEYCVMDWKAWLNIDNYGTKDIFYNFICLFLLLISSKYFVVNQKNFSTVFEENKIIDFTIIENRKTLSDTFKYFMFIYLKSIILFYIIIISVAYSYKYTNLIYGGFLFISFYLLFKDAALSKQKNNLWKYLQYYNYLVLVGFMLFQTPFLPCPVSRDSRSYIGLEECVESENLLYQSDLLYEYPKNKIDALYMVMVQTIGVLKLDFKLLIVGNLSLFLIYIVALIQQIIFEHPYQVIVDKYHKREKQINSKSRAFKIVQDAHLKIHSEYRQIFTFMEILNGKLERLDKRIREYSNLWKQTNYVNMERENNNENDELRGIKNIDEKKENKLKEEIDVMIEEMFANDKQLAGLLDYKLVKEKVDEIRKNNMKIFEETEAKELVKQTENKLLQQEEGSQKEVNVSFNQNQLDDEIDQGDKIQIYTEGNNCSIASKEEKEQKLKDIILQELIKEVKNLFAKQYIKDKLNLYKSNHHGLDIACEIFIKMCEAAKENPLIISSSKKELELLKKLFLKYHEDEILVGNNNINKNPLIQNDARHNKTIDSNDHNVMVMDTFNNFRTYNNFDTLENENVNSEQAHHLYIRRLTIRTQSKQDNLSYYQYFKKQLWKSIDKVLLIDLISNKKTKLSNLLELIIFSVYTNIEKFLVCAFIINSCVDASIMSLFYPISYFGYGLIEYPFPNKYYWKTITVYALITITLKLIYQFPFFCGYPFLSAFNIFNENYCEDYNLQDQDIMEGFEFILGLRKYNGKYSYPKNAGLLSGILWDIIILCLLLIMRSLLKSKGLWNFVNINKEFMKVPTFENKNSISSGHDSQPEVLPNQQPVIINRQNERENSYLKNLRMFFTRLVPELFLKEKSIIYKPGFDYYPLSFAALLVITMYTLFFFGSITGKNDNSISELLDKQQFSKDLVYTIVGLIFIIVIDRIIYKLRSINNEFIFEKFKKIDNIGSYGSNHRNTSQSIFNNDDRLISEAQRRNREDIQTSNMALIIKLVLHYTLLIGVHIVIFFSIPLNTHIYFFNNTSLMILYLLFCIYFYFSSVQIKYGFPLVTKGQYFAGSTRLSNRIAFKIYRNVPFLYEMRAILDWTITRTSLDLFQWFKMEDAYANLYEVKCDMDIRKKRKNGEDRWWFEKVSWGFCFFFFLMFILILPMILFSSFNPNLVENKVLSGKFSINLELKNPDNNVSLYSLTLFEVNNLKFNNITHKDQNQYNYLKNFLISQVDDVEERKIQKVKVVNFSQLDWIISPPTINALLKHLEKKINCFVSIDWNFHREYPPNNKDISGNAQIPLNREQVATLRNIIFALKTHQKPEQYKLDIKDAFPKIIRLSNKQVRYVKFDSKHKTGHKENTDIELQLIKDNERDIYWKLLQKEEKLKELTSCIYLINLYFSTIL